MSKKILFVDNDASALSEIEKRFQLFRSEWNTEFSQGGAAAISALNGDKFDAIVTKMRMPGMSGAELLGTVKRDFPHLLRFAVLEESDQDSLLQAVAIAHHYLGQSDDPTLLRSTLRRAFALQDAVNNTTVATVMHRMDRLPSAPSIYTRLVAAMQAPGCSISDISSIVEQDIAIAAKLLQLANSPLFGFRYEVSNVNHAVSLLGIDTVKSMALSIGVFSQFTGTSAQEAEVASLWEHSVLASRMARRIAEKMGLEKKAIDDSFTAGLLHEIGRLVLITQLPKEWAEVKRVADTEKLSLSDAEWKVLSCSRDEIGAYLLESWSLPVAIVEAVAWRSRPSLSQIRKPGPLAAVHLADCLCSKVLSADQEYTELDQEFLVLCNLDKREEEFLAECRALIQKAAH